MAISKQKKEELVAEYAELLNQSRAVFLTEYTGLDVKHMQQLRSEVRKVEGAYRVTKNTLLLLALEKSGKPVPTDLMTGQLAAGFALQEVPALAKTLTEFAKDQEQFTIKGGILGDKLLTAEQVEELAKLPTLDELRATIIGLIQTPARNVVSTVASSVQQVVNVLDAYAKQEGEVEAEVTS
ncbi:MAG TPA: 50S ribosomal protein L10 [Chloroflexi bacterium]|nr:50S ribosomal protein L10 [Chloroflexota bacterium]